MDTKAIVMKQNQDINDKKFKNPIAKLLQCKIFQGRKSKTKRNTRVKKKLKKESLAAIIQQIGKYSGARLVKMEYGKCPYCEMYASMVSYRKGYYTCINCRELVKQHINGSIQYVPINNHGEKI